MKYCCEKCFACEPPFGDFLIKNHEKTGTCEYCGAENVKLIDAKKMREVIMDRIDEEYEAVTEVDHEGESYCTFYGVPAYELDYILELIDDALLAETEWYKNDYVKGRHLPLRRAGRPEAIAGVIWFLCGPDASYITGQTLVVDGGLTITF